MKSIFVHAPARGRQYQQFLPRKGRPVRLAPEPVLVRWNSWLNAIFYLSEYFDIYREFIAEEDAEAAMQVSKQVHLISISYGNLVYRRPNV